MENDSPPKSSESPLVLLFGDETVVPDTKTSTITLSIPSPSQENIKIPLNLRLCPKHSLWAHVIWNATKYLVHQITNRNPKYSVKNKNILELGSSSGYLAIVSLLYGAKNFCATEFPEPIILETLAHNMNHYSTLVSKYSPKSTWKSMGFLWSSPIDDILKQHGKFDIIFMCDILFNHLEHKNMLKIIQSALKPDGEAWMIFGHHVNYRKTRDLGFFELAKDFNVTCKLINTHWIGPMFPDDPGDPKERGYVYSWRIVNGSKE